MAPPGQRLLDRLLRDGQITAFQHERAVHQADRCSEHAEEALLSLGAIKEADLLKYKASIYQTQFVSTQKLATAAADRAAMTFIPRKAAEKLLVFPILYDRKQHRLSVVAADFEDHDVVKQVQLVTGLNRVAAYVARPAAIRALQRKHYRGEGRSFTSLGLSEGTGTRPHVPVLESAGSRAPQAAKGARKGFPASVPAKVPPPSPPVSEATELGERIRRKPVPVAMPVSSSASPALPRPVDASVPPPLRTVAMPESGPAAEGVSQDSFEELGKLLVTLLEHGRGPLRGHSATVARLADQLAGRLGLSLQMSFAIRIAAYFHDLGKGDTYHLTALNVAEYDGHRAQAKKTYLTGLRYLDRVSVPEETVRALTHMYERFDGNGFPERLSGRDIPLSARVLAVMETYCDLTSHMKNPFRRKLTSKDAWDALKPFRGKIFDPDVMDVARSLTLGESAGGDGEQGTVVVVDPDPEHTMVLELRLMERGYRVVVVRDAKEALERLDPAVHALIAEVELEPFDGFELLQRARATAPDVPVLFLTSRSEGAAVKKGFNLGALDFLVKPVQAEVVVAKLEQVLTKRDERSGAAGVSGSLQEMSLPDVIQILSNGRRSGTLTLTSKGVQGSVFFHDGALWDASFGDRRAAEAVYAMLTLEDGEFSFSREGTPSERQIHDSTEALLLEGMRRLDERDA